MATTSTATRSGATAASRASRLSSSGRRRRLPRGTTPTTCGPWCAPGTPAPPGLENIKARVPARAVRHDALPRPGSCRAAPDPGAACAPRRLGHAPATPSGPAWSPRGGGRAAVSRSARATSSPPPPVLSTRRRRRLRIAAGTASRQSRLLAPRLPSGCSIRVVAGCISRYTPRGSRQRVPRPHQTKRRESSSPEAHERLQAILYLRHMDQKSPAWRVPGGSRAPSWEFVAASSSLMPSSSSWQCGAVVPQVRRLLNPGRKRAACRSGKSSRGGGALARTSGQVSPGSTRSSR